MQFENDEIETGVFREANRVSRHSNFGVGRAWGIIMLGLLITGCATVVQTPPLRELEGEISSEELALSSWAKVLRSSVGGLGRVDFNRLGKNPGPLYEYVSYVAKISPETNPEMFLTAQDRLAYHINSYNALAMYGVLSHNFPSDFHNLWDRAKFFKFTRFTIGGKEISLVNYENDVIRPLGDPRIHFALNCMVRACPRLPQEPFQAKSLNADLNRLTREFVNHPRHVQVLPSERLVRLSEIFKFYKKDFVNKKTASSLIEYVNTYRDEPIDKNFKVEFIDYDWTVNYK